MITFTARKISCLYPLVIKSVDLEVRIVMNNESDIWTDSRTKTWYPLYCSYISTNLR